METQKENVEVVYVRREQWGPGPWNHEPDRVEWRHNGYPCLIVRASFGNLCGYVAIPPGHPYYGKTYEKLRVSAHGGLTYSDRCQGHICHTPAPGEPDNVWWLGFDCAHATVDYIPAMAATYGAFVAGEPEGYKDIDYVKREVEILADTLRAVEKRGRWAK